ncbi:hypothetical protein B0H10DRAFT_1320760 [Mycena sp. CBHHK59/15]|nr:hypothetical protein B0H10DRAFT_1320760 [Mycena sp. CBHHK59/15]
MASHLKFDGLLTDWLFPPKRSPIRSAPDHLLFTNSPPSDSEAQEAQGIIADEKQRLHLLDEKIVYIQRKLLVPLLQQRDEAQQRIDQHACVLAPVRRMPSEILCDIFYLTLLSAELSYGSFETSESPWVLTHVCRHWRNIAISFPSLWNTIILRRVRCPLNMLQAQIKRAGNVLLEVRTSYLLEDVVGALAACSPRWGIVHCLPSLLSAISGVYPCYANSTFRAMLAATRTKISKTLQRYVKSRYAVQCWVFTVSFTMGTTNSLPVRVRTWEEHIPALDLMRNLVQCQLCVVGLRYAHPHPIELPSFVISNWTPLLRFQTVSCSPLSRICS